MVVAFGQILPKDDPGTAPVRLCQRPCLPASQIPGSRAHPVGVSSTGRRSAAVTTMLMDEGLDTGDMLEKVVIPIDREETGGSLS